MNNTKNNQPKKRTPQGHVFHPFGHVLPSFRPPQGHPQDNHLSGTTEKKLIKRLFEMNYFLYAFAIH